MPQPTTRAARVCRTKRVYRLRNKPTVPQYVRALDASKPKERELLLLRRQYAAPNKTVTATELARLAKVGGHQIVNATYGRFAHRLCDRLGIDPDDGSGSAKNRWWSVISVGHWTNIGFLWEMHVEVAEALEQLGWVEPIGAAIPEEVDESQPFVEGAVRRILVNAFERNIAARRRCIEHHGCRCSVCGFDFESRYGQIASGFIHVHHLRRLSEIAEQYQVDPVNDLCPICPNCHAMLHRRIPPFTVQELREIIRANGPAPM